MEKYAFLHWLFDNSDKKHLWCMNLVSTLLIRLNGLITSLFWRIWIQNKDKAVQAKLIKLELAKDMLLSLRKITDSRLWVLWIGSFCAKIYFNGLLLIISIG